MLRCRLIHSFVHFPYVSDGGEGVFWYGGRYGRSKKKNSSWTDRGNLYAHKVVIESARSFSRLRADGEPAVAAISIGLKTVSSVPPLLPLNCPEKE